TRIGPATSGGARRVQARGERGLALGERDSASPVWVVNDAWGVLRVSTKTPSPTRERSIALTPMERKRSGLPTSVGGNGPRCDCSWPAGERSITASCTGRDERDEATPLSAGALLHPPAIDATTPRRTKPTSRATRRMVPPPRSHPTRSRDHLVL